MKKIIENKSKIQGTGIFAAEDIEKGEYVCKIEGKKIKWHYNEKTDRKKCANWFGVARDLWIDPSYPLSQLNHSCNPNIGLRGMIRFYALKKIKKGDEITFDYSTSEEESEWIMECLCGSKNCRHKITSIQFLPKRVFNDYLPYIPTYFQKIYRKYGKKI